MEPYEFCYIGSRNFPNLLEIIKSAFDRQEVGTFVFAQKYYHVKVAGLYDYVNMVL